MSYSEYVRKIAEDYILELYNGRNQLYNNWECYDSLDWLQRDLVILYWQAAASTRRPLPVTWCRATRLRL